MCRFGGVCIKIKKNEDDELKTEKFSEVCCTIGFTAFCI